MKICVHVLNLYVVFFLESLHLMQYQLNTNITCRMAYACCIIYYVRHVVL